MLELHVYVKKPLNIVYLEVTANIKCFLFIRKMKFLRKKKCQVIFTTNMLAYLEIYNSFVSDVYMDDI